MDLLSRALLVTRTVFLRYDLHRACVEGPVERLNSTVVCQPAIFVASMAAVEKLRCEH